MLFLVIRKKVLAIVEGMVAATVFKAIMEDAAADGAREGRDDIVAEGGVSVVGTRVGWILLKLLWS